jgi:hypothetical protein
LIRQKLRWMAPIAVGALVGLCVLLWLLLSAERSKQAVVAVPSSDGVSRSSPPLPTSPVQVPAPATKAVHVPPKAPAPAGGPPPSSAETAVKRPDATVEAAALAAKVDHLNQARDAFNARDWARAIEEGKRAVAAGGGAEAIAVVGNTYFKMGRFAEAEQAYAKAVALDPESTLLRDRLSIAHARVQESTNPQKR